MERLPLAGRSEANPYPSDIPPEVAALSGPLFAHLSDVIQTLRRTHNIVQAGDSTFPWEMLTWQDKAPRHTLGSLGRFWHPRLGLLMARYCKFQFMQPAAESTPVGLLVGQNMDMWTVTNDIKRTKSRFVLGLTCSYTTPVDNKYGWILIDGLNVLPVAVRTDSNNPLYARVTWNGSDQLTENGVGRVVGDVMIADGRESIPPVGAFNYAHLLPPGSLLVQLQGESQAQVDAWILSQLDPFNTRLTGVEFALVQLQGSQGLAGLTLRVNAAEGQIAGIDLRLNQETTTRMGQINGLDTRIAALEAIPPGTAVNVTTLTTNLTNLTTDFNTFKLSSVATDANYGMRIGSLESTVAAQSANLTTINSYISGILAAIGAGTFTGLIDTPDNYTGMALDYVRVKADESGLEFFDLSASLAATYTPRHAGAANRIPFFADALGALTSHSLFVYDQTIGIGIGTNAPAARFQIAGSLSQPSWTTTGRLFDSGGGTYTDTTSAAAATIATRAISSFRVNSLSAANAITVTIGANMYLEGINAGANVTLTHGYAMYITGGGSAAANAAGLRVDSPTAGTNNGAAIFSSGNAAGRGVVAIFKGQSAGSTVPRAAMLTIESNSSVLVAASTLGNVIDVNISGIQDTTTAVGGTNALMLGSRFTAGSLLATNTTVTTTIAATIQATGFRASTNQTITNGIVFYVPQWTANTPGVTTNAYGLYIRNATGATNAYGAYFEGRIGVGVVAPTEMIDVNGAVKVSDLAYSAAWSGDLRVPTRNAVYNRINTIEARLTAAGIP